MSIKHRTGVERVLVALKLTGAAAMALSFIMMMVLAGCSPEPDPGDPAMSGTITILKNGAVVTTANSGETLTANYSGFETVNYQWKKNDTAITSGGTSQTYTPAEGGNYTVTVSATGFQSKTSAAVAVSGDPLPVLEGTITISPVSGVTIGTYLIANYSGSETVTYQWKRGETNVGTDANNYTPTEAGSYTVTVSASAIRARPPPLP
jgi:hypothetical protein